MKVTVTKPSPELLKAKGVSNWPIWTKEKSNFDWHYDSKEECYILAGKVRVTAKSGEVYEFGAGDFVTFPQGLSCVWEVFEPVRKHYNFE